MELILQRTHKGVPLTKGVLEVPGVFKCDTLELPEPIATGTYKVCLTTSGRAQKGGLWTPWEAHQLPELLNVPGHTAIRIHAGNTVKDTQLCILVGWDWIGNTLMNSRSALAALRDAVRLPCFITIFDPKE